MANIEERKQTLTDKFICGVNHLRYSILDPFQLKIARLRHEKDYINEENPLISYMIPTYDRGKLLVERTLPSVFNQTYKNFEVVIVGDNCPNDSLQILTNIQHPQLHFYNLKKRGNYPTDPVLRWFVAGCAPANKALDLVKGKWIAWLDDDDVLSPDHAESLLLFAKKGKYEFVAGLCEEEKNGKRRILGYKTVQCSEFGGHSTWLYRSYLKFFKYNANSWRKKWNKPADIDLQFRMRAAGVRMECLNKVVTYVLPRPGETTIGLDAHKMKHKAR